jgi:tripartite-type tricarboxylate transporter receptor subunit TctC
MNLRTTFFLAASLVTALGVGSSASAQDWPMRPVLVVSPFTAGSANDIVARLVLDQVGQQIGQTFVVENRPGGGGIVGVASVVRAEPDGYTLLLSSASMSSAVILHSALPYDELHDLVPIAMLGAQPSVLVAAPGKNFNTVAELVSAAKARPGQLDFASAGIGSASHIAGERFRLAAGLQVQHIPYRGPVEALSDLMTGRIDFLFSADRACAAADQAGQSGGARGLDAGAGAVIARCADHRRSRLSGCRVSVLGRDLGAGQDSAGDRRQAQSRGQQGAGETSD